MSSAWSRPADIAAKVRRRWDSGALLRSYAGGEPFEPISIALRGPRPGEIADDLAAAAEWVRALDAGRRDDARYRLRWRQIGGRSVGRNEIPTHAVVETHDQAWALLGVSGEVRRFDAALDAIADRAPARAWALAQPMKAVELSGEMPTLMAAYDWLEANRGSGHYLREITAPGVDTKFAESHRGVLAKMLGVSTRADEFLLGLGLSTPPASVHLRLAPTLGLLPGLSEIAVRVDEAADLPVRARRALVIENRLTYLSVPVPADGVVIWGQGFDVVKLGRLPWLAEADVVYWGDLDPRGFEILNLVRSRLPQTRSVLMDRATLLRYRERWVTEASAPPAAAVGWLGAAEQDLYRDLIEDRLGERVRLEQERIDWGWALERLPPGGQR